MKLTFHGAARTVTGSRPYDFLAEEYGTPAVVTGFNAEDILAGIYDADAIVIWPAG